MTIDDATLGAFVGAVFLPYIPPIVGAIFALFLVIMLISYFRMSLPEDKFQ